MITYLKLRNFRSIAMTAVALPKSEMTVIVGANGSGKSNVVRALDFVATMHNDGITAAVIGQGGQKSLLPKSLPHTALRSTVSELAYRVALSAPPDYPTDVALPGARHTIGFRVGARNEVVTENEVLEFEQVLPVARALATPSGVTADGAGLPRQSKLRLTYRRNGPTRVSAFPKIQNKYVAEYVRWFGFHFLEEMDVPLKTRQDLLQMIEALRKQTSIQDKRSAEAHATWLVDPLLSLSEHARAFRNTVGATKRFELHGHSLKTEQAPTKGHALGPLGTNLPAVIRQLSSSQGDSEAWERILSTLRDIAPFVFGVRNNLLKTGREYIEFIEARTGRPVESWDSSDGTLRALAMLAAVETHRKHSTMILEEPEHGLHPWAVRFLMRHIRDAAHRRDLQVILTTHSPQVVEAARPEEVIIATRTHERGTRLHLAAEILGSHDLSSGDLGRLWLKGLIGGYPHDV